MAKGKLAVNLEYAALRLAAAALALIPYRIALAFAGALAVAASRVLRFKRARTLARIRSVFPALSAREAARIAERSLASAFRIGVELMRMRTFDRRWMDAHIVEGERYTGILREHLGEGKGAVVMLPHTGNWYLAANAMAAYGIRMVGLGSRQRNPKIDAWMKANYGDMVFLDRDDRHSLVRIKESIREGRAFAIMPDLRVRAPDVEVDFLGGKANVSHAGAFFAVKCGSPIVLAATRREGARHVIDYLGTLRPQPDAEPKAEAARLTREAMRRLDAYVREHPGDWYWYNKRWILEPVMAAGSQPDTDAK